MTFSAGSPFPMPNFPIVVPGREYPNIKRKRENDIGFDRTVRQKIEFEEKRDISVDEFVKICKIINIANDQVNSFFSNKKNPEARFNKNVSDSLCKDWVSECEEQLKKVTSVKFSIKEKEITEQNDAKLFFRSYLNSLMQEYAKLSDITVFKNRFKVDRSLISSYNIDKRLADKDFICHTYVLYELDFPEEYWLYPEENDFPFRSKEAFEEFRKEFNLVEVVDAQKGDMIVYLDEMGNPRHSGIMINSETVRSKWGKNPQIFAHPIHVSPYGQSYIILRIPEEK